MCLVHGAVVIAGQQMQMGDTHGLDVIQTGAHALGSAGSLLDDTQELALVGDTGILVHTQVADMELVDDGIGDMTARVGVTILIPAGGVGGAQVDDHGALAVDAGGAGIGVAGLPDALLQLHGKGVVGAVQVAGHFGSPGARHGGLHFDLVDAILHAGSAGAVEVDFHGFCSGCPEPEGGLLLRPASAEIRPGVGVLSLKFFSGVQFGHGHKVTRFLPVKFVRSGKLETLPHENII